MKALKQVQAICDHPVVEEHTGETVLDSRVERLAARWNEIFDERDTIVHRLSQASGWSDDKIREAAKLTVLVMKRLSEVLAEDADHLISEHTNRAAASGGGSHEVVPISLTSDDHVG